MRRSTSVTPGSIVVPARIADASLATEPVLPEVQTLALPLTVSSRYEVVLSPRPAAASSGVTKCDSWK